LPFFVLLLLLLTLLLLLLLLLLLFEDSVSAPSCSCDDDVEGAGEWADTDILDVLDVLVDQLLIRGILVLS